MRSFCPASATTDRDLSLPAVRGLKSSSIKPVCIGVPAVLAPIIRTYSDLRARRNHLTQLSTRLRR